MRKTPSFKLTLIFSLFLLPHLLFAGLMEYPRRVNVIQTQYFDILFPDECGNTAKVVADNADYFFDKAFTIIQGLNKFRCPIVITPDSSKLSVTYASTPYNRIVIYDSVADIENVSYRNILLDLLNHEIFRAVSQSKKSAFWHYMSVILGYDALQPISLINMPFSFAEGLTYAREGDDNNGIINDQFYMQILIQAKLENRLPDWIQCTGARDIYPDDHLAMAAGSAFSAYIQQRWGFEKYLDYWNECGKAYLFSLYPGDFKKVYGISLSQAWNDFKESIPLPENPIQEEKSSLAFYDDKDSLYTYLVHTAYGFVWYDEVKHEVSLFDPESEWKFNQLLFLASDINNLSISPDGRFLIVSHYKHKNRENFNRDIVYFYDLKRRKNISGEYLLRDASLIQLDDGTYAVAGISVEEKHPVFKVIQTGKLNTYISEEKKTDNRTVYQDKEIYRKEYDYSAIPFTPAFSGKGKVLYPVCKNKDWFLVGLNLPSCEYLNDMNESDASVSFDKNESDANVSLEKTFCVLDSDGEKLNIRNIRFMYQNAERENLFTFEYIKNERTSLTRSGFLLLDENWNMKKLLLQNEDISGGMNTPLVLGQNLYYTAKKLEHNEVRCINLNDIPVVNGNIEILNYELPLFNSDAESVVQVSDSGWWLFKERTLGDYELKNYNPFYYMFRGTFIPMLPVREIDLNKGRVLFPGLGLTYFTQTDPFFNNDITLSTSLGFAKLDFSKLFNADEESLIEFRDGLVDFNRLFSFAGYIHNTSTPIDVILGALFNFNIEGSYKFQGVFGGSYSLPLGMTVHNLTLSAQYMFTVSTSYMDEKLKNTHPELPGWIDISQAYRDMRLSTTASYSCIHQFGISPYENRGIQLGASLYAIWDINYIEEKQKEEKMLQAAREADKNSSENQNESTVTSVNNSQSIQTYQQLYGSFYNATQFYLGLFSKIEIPYLTPIKNQKGWILSVPGTIYAELMNTSGTAFKAYGEFLLVGKEIQQGIAPLLLYFSRVGLKVGYEIAWLYDVYTLSPDLRQMDSFYDIFTNTYFRDNIYAIIHLGMVPVFGKLSTSLAQGYFKFAYYPQNNAFKFSFDFKFNF